MLEMQRHWGTRKRREDGDKGKLLKASGTKGPDCVASSGQKQLLGAGLLQKKGLCRKEVPGSRLCRLALCQVMGLVSGYSVGHGVHTSPWFSSVGNSDSSAQKSRAPGNSQQGATTRYTLDASACICSGIVRRPCCVCLAISWNFQDFVAWSTPSVKLYHVSGNVS